MSDEAEYVSASPSTSAADKTSTFAISSFVLPSAISARTGASFTFSMVNISVSIANSPDVSVAVITISTLPTKSSVGYTIKDVESVLLEDLPSLPGLLIAPISKRADLSSLWPNVNDFP